MSSIVNIDGSMLEGGGQILRTATALSAILGIPIRVFNIRAKRKPQGLRPQHLTAVRTVASLSNAHVENLLVGSTEIVFKPRQIKGGSYNIDIHTAGSITLVLQAFMPVAAFANSLVNVEIRGGTNVSMSPPIEYLQEVLLPLLKILGVNVQIKLLRYGFYPKGGGIVQGYIEPIKNINPINITEDFIVKRVFGIAYSSRLPRNITERMSRTARNILAREGFDVDVETLSLQPDNSLCAVSPGCGISVFAESLSGLRIGANSLGEPGKPAEKVAEEASKALIDQVRIGAPIDKYLGDQLIIWISLANGTSKIRVSEYTLHTATCIELCKIIANVDFRVYGNIGDKNVTIECRGIGAKNLSSLTSSSS
ncbi:MAG: RNA 3'-terminal phosphate cyclase [Candidatus Methanomethylicia archaeon]